jgi:hypothetical protein
MFYHNESSHATKKCGDYFATALWSFIIGNNLPSLLTNQIIDLPSHWLRLKQTAVFPPLFVHNFQNIILYTYRVYVHLTYDS